MKKFLAVSVILVLTLSVTACSVFGRSSVEIAPYQVLKKDEQFELRHYPELILVSTPMQGMDDQGKSFRKLFGYISGKNEAAKKIPMTAPVFLDQVNAQTDTMSFVLPADYDFESTPLPNDPSITLERISDYTVAVVTFNGRLQQKRIETFKLQLHEWIKENNFNVTGAAKAAGYNPPFTLPALRRNEVMIPVKKA